MLALLHELGKGGGFTLAALWSVTLGCLVAIVQPGALVGFAAVVGTAVGFLTVGGAAKAIAESRNGKPPA